MSNNSQMSSEVTSNKLYLGVYQALQDPVIRNVLEIPMLVLVAGQSAGKSFLISHIAQYLITFMDSSVGTRCPVRYDFRNADDIGTERFTVNGVVCERGDVARLVREAMLAVERTSPTQFSNVEIEVIICRPGVKNIIIVDMPGFPDSNQPHYTQTKGLIVDMLTANPRAIIVAVIDASVVDPANRGNSAGFDEVLSEVRPRWREGTIFVNNKINMALPHISNVNQLQNFFRPVPGKDEYYVILHPSSGEPGTRDIHLMSTPEVSAYIGEVYESKEETALTRHLRNVIERQNGAGTTGGEEVLTALRRKFKFGVKELERGLHKRIHQEIINQLPSISKRLEVLHQDAAREVEKLKKELSFRNPSETRDLYNQYISQLTLVIKAILDHKPHNMKGLEAHKYAMLFQDELQHAHAGAEDEEQLDYAHLVATLGNYRDSRKSLKKMVETMKMGGNAACTRMLLVYGLQMLSAPHEAPDEDDVFNGAIAPVNGYGGEASFAEMVMQDVKPNIGKLSKLTPWLKNHLSFLLKRLYTCAQDHIGKKEHQFAPIREHHGFHEMLFRKYLDVVNTRTNAIGGMVDDMIQDYQTTFTLDSSYRSIPMMALASTGDLPIDILPQPPRVQLPDPAAPAAPAVPLQDDVPAVPAAANDVPVVVGAVVDNATGANGAPPPQWRGLVGLHGTVHDLPPRVLRAVDTTGNRSVAESVSGMITAVQTHPHSFDLVDILKLDVEHYANQSMFDMDITKSTMVAKRQFFSVKTELYKSVERSVSAQFSYFNDKYLKTFSAELSAELGKYTNEQLHQYSGYDLEQEAALQTCLDSETALVQKLEALQTSLQKYYHAPLSVTESFEGTAGSLSIVSAPPTLGGGPVTPTTNAPSTPHNRDGNGESNSRRGNRRNGGGGNNNNNNNNNNGGTGGNGAVRGATVLTSESILSHPDVSGPVVNI